MARGLPLWVIGGESSALVETALEFRDSVYRSDMAQAQGGIGRHRLGFVGLQSARDVSGLFLRCAYE